MCTTWHWAITWWAGPIPAGSAQYALATTTAIKPADLSWERAVALPVAGATAQRVLDLLEIVDGEVVLMHGAAGAVGTVAVQLAVARGARVIATAGPANQSYLTSLGATATVYGDGLVDRVRALALDGIDAVFDLAGKGALEDSITLRNGTERIVTTSPISGLTSSASPSPAGPPNARRHSWHSLPTMPLRESSSPTSPPIRSSRPRPLTRQVTPAMPGESSCSRSTERTLPCLTPLHLR